MSKIKTIISKFQKECEMLLVKADDPRKISFNTAKKAISYLERELASLAYNKLQAEAKVEEAKELLHVTKFSPSWLNDTDNQLDNIDDAQDNLDIKKEELSNIVMTIDNRTKLLYEYQQEVEAE